MPSPNEKRQGPKIRDTTRNQSQGTPRSQQLVQKVITQVLGTVRRDPMISGHKSNDNCSISFWLPLQCFAHDVLHLILSCYLILFFVLFLLDSVDQRFFSLTLKLMFRFLSFRPGLLDHSLKSTSAPS